MVAVDVAHVGSSSYLFGPIVGLPPAAGAIGLFFLIRHSSRLGERVKYLHAMLLLAAAAYAVIARSHRPTAILVGFCIANIDFYASMKVF